MPTTDTRRVLDERAVPIGLLALLGIALGVSAFEFLLHHPDSPLLWRTEVLVVAALTSAPLYGGYRLYHGDHGPADAWTVLGWTLAGVAAALALGAGIYVHQQTEHATLAEPRFTFEVLSLVGATTGLAVGVSRRRLPGGDDAGLTSAETTGTDSATAGPSDSERFWEALSMLEGDTTVLEQRWAMVEHLAGTSTRELPVDAFVVRLAGEEFPAFPDDEHELSTLLSETHLPALRDNDLVEVDDELGTVRYVGPDSIGAYLER